MRKKLIVNYFSFSIYAGLKSPRQVLKNVSINSCGNSSHFFSIAAFHSFILLGTMASTSLFIQIHIFSIMLRSDDETDQERTSMLLSLKNFRVLMKECGVALSCRRIQTSGKSCFVLKEQYSSGIS